MNSWIETALAVAVSFALFRIAWRTPGLRFVWFGAGLLGIGVAYWFAPSLYHRPCAMLKTVSVPLFVGPLFQFPMSRVLRFCLPAAGLLTVFSTGWLEFLAPAISGIQLAKLETRISHDGVCIQTTDYTCGPAAAVTLLRRHEFDAEEGDIAIRAKASFFTGVDGPMLAAAVQGKYHGAGVTADTAVNQTMDQLRLAGECLAVVPFDTFSDHWVAVLEVDQDKVVMADPIVGIRTMPRPEFERTWRREIVRIHFPAARR